MSLLFDNKRKIAIYYFSSLLFFAMVALFNNCNLSIVFNPSNNEIIFDDESLHKEPTDVSLSSLLPTLLNRSLNYPRTVYNEYLSVYSTIHSHLEETEVSHDILYIPAGLLGIEYVRSRIYYSPENSTRGSIDSIIEVLYGQLTIILQKNKDPEDEFEFETTVEEGHYIKLEQGEKIVVPKGYFYTFVNTTEFPVIFVRLNQNHTFQAMDLLKKEGGLAYFCIRKNAKPEVVHNPRYKNTPSINRTKSVNFSNDNYSLPDSSLYEFLVNEKSQLEEMLCSYC